ncbi:YbaB/EbfC family nucleoid-associated protein [Nonomuraea jiangxiensis]|uniref:Conserved DNA-binding protein YbaB n=1 Tax=Nonomuraea jiangxiensis TaxID=633440 RepID=A0A1G8FKE8_9ACTN|nr:YbaB/EbfC family nucleoid-associated protein [Nonomuraea jiangxiensis]SDH82496.1 Conserved DNA-binding protein YbaB [Nonomuraea jiangxiensis]
MKNVRDFAEGREGDVNGLLREVNEWTGALAGAMEGLSREELEGVDETGVVHVKVSGEGRLLRLNIDPRGLRDLDHVQLAAAVKQAIGAAHTAMGDRLTELTAHLTGPQTSVPDGGDPLAPHIERLLREG